MKIRPLKEEEKYLLKDFLYEAIFIPEGIDPPDRSIIEKPELSIYYEGFGEGPADYCLLVEEDGKVIGAAWSRIMNDYGHLDDETPSLAISLYREYRNKGIGTKLMKQLLKLLKEKGYRKVIIKNYILIYRIDEKTNTVYILHFVYGNRITIQSYKQQD